MIKLIDLIPSTLLEDIDRDPRYWINEFNLLGVVQQFSNQFQQRMGVPFYGKLNLIVFDRSNLKEIEDHIDKNHFLSGYVPKGKDEFWDEDFMITLEDMYPKSKLISELTPIKDKVFLMQIECSRNPQNGETVVTLPSYW